jgi:hypothetical protein
MIPDDGKHPAEPQTPEGFGQTSDAITVFVNELPVRLHGHVATGAEIKAAAIAQGAPIHEDFQLQEELPNGGGRIIADADRVHLHEHLRFIALAPTIEIFVNEQPVKFQEHWATGAEIKAAAIAQHVHIQPNFVLQEELPNGTSRIVGDRDRVHLRDHLRFTAIAPDDNS